MVQEAILGSVAKLVAKPSPTWKRCLAAGVSWAGKPWHVAAL